MKKFYLTTPIYYPNARPHVGNSYTTMVCDAVARYKRMCGYDVAYLTGTDEHGEKLERAAAEAGVSPQEFVAAKRDIFYNLWRQLNINYSHFIFTDRADHVRSVQRMLIRARDAGCIDKRAYKGRYCVHDELYVSDSTEPIDCPNCGRPAELVSEENYFFKLSAFQDRLLEYYEKHPEFVQPDFRMNEVRSFVKSGLRDISVSRRRIKWGIPWPDDPEQVFYVWYDALTGYLTGIGFAEGENGNAEFQKFWPADLHMIGKDILRFHAVYWPAFLMAANLPLPKTIFAHGWLYYLQDKMSKSKGNVIYCEPIVQELGADPLRYYLMRDVPFGQDINFSLDGMVDRFNADLANDLGNLANRTVNMLNRYFDGVVPQAQAALTNRDETLKSHVIGSVETYRDQFNAYNFSRALETIWQSVSELNKYLVLTQPWTLADSGSEADRERLGTILSVCYESLRLIVPHLYPVIPQSAERLWKQLGQEGKLEDQRLDQLQWGGLKPGTRVTKPEIVFPRLDREATLKKLDELEDAARLQEKNRKEGKKQVEEPVQPQSQAQPVVEPQRISIDDFAKVEMRVGEVKAAEHVPGATKLLKLMVDIGAEVRQIVAGLAESYQPESLIGMKVVVVTNLQPRKLRGVESNGMVVAASGGEQGRPVLVTFKEDVPNGARLK